MLTIVVISATDGMLQYPVQATAQGAIAYNSPFNLGFAALRKIVIQIQFLRSRVPLPLHT